MTACADRIPTLGSHHGLSRRRLVQAGLAGAVLPLLPVDHSVAGSAVAGGPSPLGRGIELATQASAPSPAAWRTWILAAPDQLRPPAPPEPTPDEIAELRQLQMERNDETLALIQQWNSRPAVLPWTEVANAAFAEFKAPPVRQSRAQGLLQTAMHDAIIAAYDAQDAYEAAMPTAIDSAITPVAGSGDARPAYPSAEAAVAGAAAAVLMAILPNAAPLRFLDLAKEAATTRLQAGLNFRRDIETGLALGLAIGQRAVSLAADDQPGSAWDGSGRLTGPGYWEPTPPAFVETPLEPLAGTWKLWVMESADEFRAGAPPAYQSPAWQSQIAAVQEAVAHRTFSQAQRAKYWQLTAGSALWNGFAGELITRDGLDLPHAARVLALLAVAQADAQVACWDSKYAYWTERPITADPDLDVLFPTPPFPSYPSGHATISNAGAVVLSHLFPEDAADLLNLAEEAAASRCWAGIHYPIDDDAGTLLGRNVGYLVIAMTKADRAE